MYSDKSGCDTSDIISDSSGVGTSSDTTLTSINIGLPGTTVVCVQHYNSGLSGHLLLTEGDIIEGKVVVNL